MQLRPYQREAVDAALAHCAEHSTGGLIVIPTGGGKSLVQATLIQETLDAYHHVRVLCLTHVRELLLQNMAEIREVWPMAPIGVNSASIGARNYDSQILVAGIASVYKAAPELGHFDLVIIDEAHLVNPESAGMYRALLADLRVINPALRVLGMTATPYRLGSGMLTEGADALFGRIAYEAQILDLIRDGFLAPLKSKGGTIQVDLSQVAIRGGEYVAGEMERAYDHAELTQAILADVATLAKDRKHWLLFCSGVSHAQHVRDALQAMGITAGCVTGDTPKEERAAIVGRFKSGEIQALTNNNVLTTGFNAPATDLLVFLRPTQSTSLYVQMAGRGMRNAPGKTDCLVLDYAGNVVRHGPVDAVRIKKPGSGKDKDEPGEAPAKECPQCRTIVHAGMRTCPDCGFEFPKPEPAAKLERLATTAPVLSTEIVPVVERWKVTEVSWHQHWKKGSRPGDGTPTTLCVCYQSGTMRSIREWVCVEHEGFARSKAERWLRDVLPADVPLPSTVPDALVTLGRLKAFGTLRLPTELSVKIGGQYPEISARHFGGPCATCRHFEGGFCARWDADVPKANQDTGCTDHTPAPTPTLSFASSIPESEVPF